MLRDKEKKEIALREKEMIEKEQGELTKEGVQYSPVVDIFETTDAITVLADLPGVEKDQLDINIEDRQLTITGLVKSTDDRFQPVYPEYGVGGFSRSFRLGDAIDQSKITASLEEGVLTLVIPKAERLKPRKIQVSTS